MVVGLKTQDELNLMRRANMLVYEILQELKSMVAPGVTTNDLDKRARELLKAAKAEPAFLNYPCSTRGGAPFPGVICASRNEEIVHGIPNNEPLKDGDILSIDFGCSISGFFGDSALTVPVGAVSAVASRLMEITNNCLEQAILQCFDGKRIGDISYSVQTCAEAAGFGVVREFVGHGIGRAMHEPPHIPNYGKPFQGRVLKEGMVLAIEPMITEKSYEVNVLSDGWTAVTRDGGLAAHFEHTVAITKNGPWVLSRP